MTTSNDISRIKTKLAEEKGSLDWLICSAAFALALRWKLEGDHQCTDAAAKILGAWGETLEVLETDSDSFLTAGLQGFELANTGELLRDYELFIVNGQKASHDMMVKVFLAKNILFIKHDDWSEETYDFVLDYWHTGDGNGVIALAISDIVEEPCTGKPLDQSHASLDLDGHAFIAQMAWNQGTGLYSDSKYRMLRGIAEYFARFNLGKGVPFVPYKNLFAVTQGQHRLSLQLYPGSPGYECGLGSWGERSGHYFII
ncbi:hypothetical protein OIDMADRAFT_46219 [Oidiodendron maius Zn]|uniref:Uncharacterized protein n=1 Tax=Oidiodendron maius (strain Zn) TaxID=913774 RepID=A0A0C3CUL3_OIDMZ|nr:hypothetical protein OIDMADRAFT_46219 [Oidiodendron maius Zn]